MTIRAGFYIDGFNAYHSLDEIGDNHLKWLDWSAVALKLIPKVSETVIRTCLCTAVRKDNYLKSLRHRAYIGALRAHNVDVIEGHFLDEPRDCRKCNSAWNAPVEKQGDVHLALNAYGDCAKGLVDHVYLVTADSDQAATVKMIKNDFPNIRVTTVVITGRSHSKEILFFSDSKITISKKVLEGCLLPEKCGERNEWVRPPVYAPPLKDNPESLGDNS